MLLKCDQKKIPKALTDSPNNKENGNILIFYRAMDVTSQQER